MKLVKAKTRGLGPVIESRWIDLSPHLNLFHFSDSQKGYRFLQCLQTINPPFSCESLAPFADFPEFITVRGYQRKVVASKRTVALGVFGATPELVTELGALTPLLYETDRIEVGRRMEYSRWSNFVELASSTRWSEAQSEMSSLLSQIEQKRPEFFSTISELTDQLQPSDRVKGTLGKSLLNILLRLKKSWDTDCPAELESLIEKAKRHRYFHEAREIVYRRLPLFVLINKDNGLANFHNDPSPDGNFAKVDPFKYKKNISQAVEDRTLFSLDQIKETVEMSRKISMNYFSTEPILLFDRLEKSIASKDHEALFDLITDVAAENQSLYITNDPDLHKKCPAGKAYFEHEISPD